jgi:hypothetical protein
VPTPKPSVSGRPGSVRPARPYRTPWSLKPLIF